MPAKQKWVIADPPDSTLVSEYAEHFGLLPVVVVLALQRGFTDFDALKRFLYPQLKDLSDPFLLSGIPSAVQRIFAAVDDNERVVLYGDYDVDGVTSIALLTYVLRAYGLDPDYFLPARMAEGYGLSIEGIEQCTRGDDPPTLLIAADCGTNSRDEAIALKERGIDLIILDHHEPSQDGPAKCNGLVNPKLGDDFHYLCTAGVVFKVAHALLKTRPLSDFDLKDYLDLVALGTIADIVPLIDDNRIFARRGLQQLDRTIHPGLTALKKNASVGSPATSQDVGFRIGPRINAAGRIDTASVALELLLCQDAKTGQELADNLDLQNKERQALEYETRKEAEKMIQELPSELRTRGIVVGARGWHPGVVGIVASRISKQYHRPVFVIAFDESGMGKGSGRSVPGISLIQGLDAARDVIESGGGHEMAAGVTVHESNLEAFRDAFNENVEKQITGDVLIPKLQIDAELDFSELSLGLLDSYELLRPFGSDNPQPVFMSREVEIVGEPRVINGKHLKFRFSQGNQIQDAIHFNSADQDLPNTPWDIAYTIDRNDFRGRVSLNVILKAIRKSS